MKIKISISISEDLIREIDQVMDSYGSRSGLIEQAIREFIARKTREKREANDWKILNRKASILNKEALDVLHYQTVLYIEFKYEAI